MQGTSSQIRKNSKVTSSRLRYLKSHWVNFRRSLLDKKVKRIKWANKNKGIHSGQSCAYIVCGGVFVCVGGFCLCNNSNLCIRHKGHRGVIETEERRFNSTPLGWNQKLHSDSCLLGNFRAFPGSPLNQSCCVTKWVSSHWGVVYPQTSILHSSCQIGWQFVIFFLFFKPSSCTPPPESL